MKFLSSRWMLNMLDIDGKNRMAIILFCITFFTSCWHVNAQISIKDVIEQKKQIAVGIEDSYYGYGSYAVNKWQFIVQQSFFASHINTQYWKVSTNYGFKLNKNILFTGKLVGGGTYDNQPNTYLYGGVASSFQLNNLSGSLIAFIPFLSYGGFTYKINLQYNLYKEKLMLTTAFKPHNYLANERKYLEMGILFKDTHLQVMPAFQIPDDLNMKQVLLLISFYYNFL